MSSDPQRQRPLPVRRAEVRTEDADDFAAACRKAFVERRQSLKLSQRQLAARMGVAQAVVSDLERGATQNPGIEVLRKWASALDIRMTISLEYAEVTTRVITFDALDSTMPHDSPKDE